jgi:thiamine monophosphate kinase
MCARTRLFVRSGAKAVDGIYVLPAVLVSSALGLELLKARGKLDDQAVMRHLFPEPRYIVGQRRRGQGATAMDRRTALAFRRIFTHVLPGSHVSARVYRDRLPVWSRATVDHALHGGEEYELIVVAKRSSRVN